MLLETLGFHMPLTLEQYAEHLEARNEPRPEGPDAVPYKAKPHLPVLDNVRCVIFGGYGTLMLITGGESFLINPDPVMRKISLDKTIREFAMWQSMSRKPGEPSEYMTTIFKQVLDSLFPIDPNLKDTEIPIEKIWERILGRLFQKEYVYKVAFYGDLQEFCKKISYYYLQASQGVSTFPDLLKTLRSLKSRVKMTVHGNGQSDAPVRLWRLLCTQGKISNLGELFDPAFSFWSFQIGFKAHSERGWSALLRGIATQNLKPENCLYVSSDLDRDLIPAKKRGFRTAVLLADKGSARVDKERLTNEKTRPDSLLTSLDQLLTMIPER